jgi:Spy/CpxP family protein refolding chaperone
MKKTRVIVAGASAIAVATALVGVGTVASADDASGASKGKGGVLSQLKDDGTLTSEELTAVKDALREQRTENRAEKQTEREAARASTLAGLVSDGTLTQSQADAIVAAGKRGLRDLVRGGTVDRDDVQALRAAMQDFRAENRGEKKAEREAARDAVLAGLVSDGTLTQSQADTIATAIDARIAEKGDERGKKGKRGKRGERGGFGGAPNADVTTFGARA